MGQKRKKKPNLRHNISKVVCIYYKGCRQCRVKKRETSIIAAYGGAEGLHATPHVYIAQPRLSRTSRSNASETKIGYPQGVWRCSGAYCHTSNLQCPTPRNLAYSANGSIRHCSTSQHANKRYGQCPERTKRNTTTTNRVGNAQGVKCSSETWTNSQECTNSRKQP